MIDGDIEERMARLAPSQNPQDPVALTQSQARMVRQFVAEDTAQQAGIADPSPPGVLSSQDRLAQEFAAQDRLSLNMSLLSAREVTPEQAARAKRLAEQSGVGMDVALRNMQALERKSFIRGIDRMDLPRQDPILAQFLSNPDNAKIAQDDIGTLRAEKGLFDEIAGFVPDTIGEIGTAFESGRMSRDAMLFSAELRQRTTPPSDRELNRAFEMTDVSGAMYESGGGGGILGAMYRMGGQQVDDLKKAATVGAVTAAGYGLVTYLSSEQGVFLVPVAIKVGWISGFTASMADSAFNQLAGESYLEMRRMGIDHSTAQAASGVAGLVNAGLELVGLKIASAPVTKPVSRAIGRAIAHDVTREVSKRVTAETMPVVVRHALVDYAKSNLGEVATEVTETVVNNVAASVAQFYENLGLPDDQKKHKVKLMTADGYSEMISEAADVAWETFKAMVIPASIGPGGTFAARASRIQKARQASGVIKRAMELASESRHRSLDPAAHQQLLEQRAAGTPLEDVYIDAGTMESLMRDTGVTVEDMDAVIPGFSDRLKEASASNASVRMKGAEFLAHLSETDIGRAMAPHLRAGDPRAESMFDVASYEAGKQKMLDEYRKMKSGMSPAQKAFVDSANAVEDEITKALRQTGTMSPQEVEANAELHTSFVVMLASRLKQMPSEVWSEYRNEILGPQATSSVAALAQAPVAPDSGVFDANNPPAPLADGQPIVAVLTSDGEVLYDREATMHGDLAEKFPDKADLIIDGGFIVDGKYQMGQSQGGWSAYEGEPDQVEYAQRLAARANERRPRPLEQQPTSTAADDARADMEVESESDDPASAVVEQPNVPESVDNAVAIDAVSAMARGTKWKRGRDLKLAMQRAVQSVANALGINLIANSPQTDEYLVRVGLRDALYALRQNPNSVGWYDEKTRQAIAVMGLVHPEILKDENAKFAFIWVLAATSNGIRVDKNFELAEAAYRRYKAEGRMPTDLAAGKAQEAINRSLDAFNTLRDMWGIDNLRRFAQTEYTMGELRAIIRSLESSGEYASVIVKGAAIMGPKIGNGFFSNLYGDFRSLTMDRWLIRTWGRWTGTLVLDMPVQTDRARERLRNSVTAMAPEHRAALAAIMRKQNKKPRNFKKGGKVDPETAQRLNDEYQARASAIDAFESGADVDIDVLARTIQMASMNTKARDELNTSVGGEEFRMAGNSLANYVDGQKEDPAGPAERQRIRGVFAQILAQLNQMPEYADLTMADLQAALWYAEKRLYETAKEDIKVGEESVEGYADDEAPDYANAASKVALNQGVSQRKIAATLRRESTDERSKRSRLQDEPGGTAAGGGPRAAGGFTEGQKRQFNGAAVVKTARSNRSGDGKSSWSYRRRGGKLDQKPRLVKSLGARVISTFVPGSLLRRSLDRAGGSKPFATPTFVELERGPQSAGAFHKLISDNKAKHPYGASVYVYPVSDYEGMRLFATEDGTAGFAIKPDGDIVSVFASPDAAAGHSILIMAVEQGGRKLDAFDTILPELYSIHGFRAVSRLKWDETQKPDGWDKSQFGKFNNGEPDVVFMVYDPTYFGQYSSKDGRVASSYDAAVRAQKRAVREQAARGYQQAPLRDDGATPEDGPKGTFDPDTNTTRLTQAADFSTFAHESSHYYLEVLGRIAAREGAPSDIVADFDAILQWFGIEGATAAERIAKWNSMSLEQRRPHHEAWARNFEIYLFEGKAPSVELQPVFERFKRWFKRLYKSIKEQLNEQYRQQFGKDLPVMTGEVRQVMDRLFASDEQIARAQAMREMAPMFQTQEQSGMTDAEWAAYQEMSREATDEAASEHGKASLRQMQWLSGAKSKMLKEMQDRHDEMRARIRKEVTRATRMERVYRAIDFLRRGKWLDEKGNEQQNELHRIDLEAVKRMYALEPESLRPDLAKLGYGKNGMLASEGGVDPEIVAERLGYDSADQMIRDILAAQPIDEVVDARTDQRMLAEGGELSTPEAMEEAVDAALHNEARGRFIAVELRFLAKATQPVRAMVDAARAVARQIIGAKRVRDVRPREYVAAETRAARDASEALTDLPDPETAGQAAFTKSMNEQASAVAAGMPIADAQVIAEQARQEAIRKAKERIDAYRQKYPDADPAKIVIVAKRNQLLNNQLAAEALAFRREVGKAVRYLREVLRDSNRQRMGADAAEQIETILERFDLKPVSVENAARRRSLAQWIAAQEELGLEPEVPESIANEAFRIPYQDMTVEQFREMVDMVRQIEHMGRNRNKAIAAASQQRFDEARDEIVSDITREAAQRGRAVRPETARTRIGRTLQNIGRFVASHVKAAIIVQILDGGKEGGSLWSYLIRTANAAGDRETAMRAKATEDLSRILAPLFRGKRMGGKGIHFPSIGMSLNREARIAIALNWGNDGNRQRLLDGAGWTGEQVMPVLESLTAKEWEVVQAVWDYFEQYRPMIAEKDRRLYGKEPNWVEPVPSQIRTADGQIIEVRGGYYPIKYDPRASMRAEAFAEAEEARQQMRGANISATTRASFRKPRADEVIGRPLLYDLSGLYSGVNEVIHDLCWHDWLIDANRLMRDEQFDAAVRTSLGPEAKRQLKNWIKDVATDGAGMSHDSDVALNFLRQNISASGLGFNLVSAIGQVIGFNQSFVKVGYRHMGRAMAQYMAHPLRMTRAVRAASQIMADRGRTQFRELNELRNRVQGESLAMRRLRLGVYFLMMRMQAVVDVPTWTGAYEKALEAGKDDDTAKALADQAVIDSQGSGMVKDLAAIQRGGALLKLFTVFYNYMSTVFNMAALKTMTERNRAKLAADYLMIFVVPAVMMYLLKSALRPDEDDDEMDPEELARVLASEGIEYTMGSMVIAREFAAASKIVVGAKGAGRDYSGPAGLRMIADTYVFSTQAAQLEFDEAFRRSAINLLGDALGIPSAQINRTIDGINSASEGDLEGPAANIRAILFGAEK